MIGWNLQRPLGLFIKLTEKIKSIRGRGAIFIDADGNILNWNEHFENLNGYSECEVLGQNFSMLYLSNEQKAKLSEKLIDTAIKDGFVTHTSKCVRKNGTIFIGKLKIEPITDGARKIHGFILLSEEVV